MLNCSLCKKEYSDVTKVCPLKHCSNCGSLNLHTHNKRRFQSSIAKLNFTIFLPVIGFFVFVYGYIFVNGDLISFFSIVAVYAGIILGSLLKTTIKNINCKDCTARNFPFVSNIQLNAQKSESTFDEKDLAKKISKTVLGELSEQQRKHNKKDIIVRIAGATALVIIAIIGTFFVNPDDVLLGEVIDMIKSSFNYI